MVADLLPGDAGNSDDGPTHLVMLGGTLLFAARDSVHGRELWRTDGTETGTTLLADTTSGPADGLLAYQPFPVTFYGPAVAGGLAFFGAGSPSGPGEGLWVSDGTSAGTVQLSLPPTSGFNGIFFLFAFDDVVLFSGNDRLWRSDGTPAGTYPLSTPTNGLSSPGRFTRLGNRVYFRGFEQTTGAELWATDGTPEGTALLKDTHPGVMSGLNWSLDLFTASDDRVFFSADDGTHGVELWSSDGTETGTTMVADLLAGSESSLIPFIFPIFPAQIGRHLLHEWWNQRGFVLGSLDLDTGAITRLRSTADRPGSAFRCVFDDPCLLIDETSSGIAFLAADVDHGAEPWATDGQPAATRLAADVRPGTDSSMPAAGLDHAFAELDERLLVVARDAADGSQLFAISSTGVTKLTDGVGPEQPGIVVRWKDAAYFGTAAGFWRTDGTLGGAIQLAGGDCNRRTLPGVEDLFFINFGRLWATDGTVGGTRRVAPAIDVFVQLMAATVDGGGRQRVYFAGSDTTAGLELWVTDGTDGGTHRVIDLRPGSEGGMPHDPSTYDQVNPILVAHGGRAFFVADDGTTGEELWVSDGTTGNATLLSVVDGPDGAEPRWLAAVGERIYFAADDGVHGREPWTADGTPGGTQLLADLALGPASSVPRELTAWGDRLVFSADDGVHGMELWRTGTPGMPSNVPVLLDIHPGILPSSPQGFTVSGERLFFFADDGVHGLEPWAWPVGDRLFEDGFESGDASAWEELEPTPGGGAQWRCAPPPGASPTIREQSGRPRPVC
jgi:ELWxxDGT repeat protein